MTFSTLGLSETLQRAVADSGYTSPTPIQQRAIPAILEGTDVMAAAQTGTGKTAGFTLPLLQLLGKRGRVGARQARALILTPTRELALQIQACIETYSKYEKLRSAVVFGGVNINPQKQALQAGVDILVATPGRLLDLYQQKAVAFDAIECLVLDEADRMLDMGFIHDIRKVLALLPKQRQNLMFSATFSDDIRALARTICHKPVEIDVAPRNSTVEKISQQVYMVDKEHKLPLLGKLLTETPEQVLVFSRTKHGANNLVKKLARYQVQAAAIHGNKSQSQRTKALGDFKANRIQVLVATDIAARGIDISQLALVINFDLPQVAEDYVHRIGRTGRAGATGLAVSLVTSDENRLLRDIERLIKLKIPRVEFDAAGLPEPPPAPEPEAQPRQASRQAAASDTEKRGGRSRRRSRSGGESGERRRQSAGSGARAAGTQPRGESAERNASSGSGNGKRRRRGSRGGRNAARGEQGGAGARNGSEARGRSGQRQRSAAQEKPAAQGVWASLKSMLASRS